jgi:hypothetical protein
MLIRIVAIAISFGGCDCRNIHLTRLSLPARNPSHARTRYFPNTLIWYNVLLDINRSVKSTMLNLWNTFIFSVFYKE